MGSGLAAISYAFAAMAGVCFVGGLAIISDKGVKHNGEDRDHHVDAR